MVTFNQLGTMVDDVNSNLIRFRYNLQDLENNLKYHIPLTNFYKAARAQLDATLLSFNMLVEAYDTSQDELSDQQKKYMETQLLGFSKLIDAFSLRVKPIEIDDAILEAGEYVGTVTLVDDGDTVWMDNNIEVRFPGIDTPEKGTTNGKKKKAELEALVLGKKVTAKIDPHTPLDLYQRLLATLFLEDGTNVTLAIASTCNCEVSTQYGKNMYVDAAEIKAIIAKCKVTFPGEGIVRIYGSPAKMDMWVDGYPTNTVTPKPLSLPLGRHVIELRANNRATRAIEVNVVSGEQSFNMELPKLPQTTGLVDIESDDEGMVLIDGNPYGPTPMIVDLPLDQPHEVVIQRDGYPDYQETVTVDERQMVIVRPTSTE